GDATPLLWERGFAHQLLLRQVNISNTIISRRGGSCTCFIAGVISWLESRSHEVAKKRLH
ncbi:MAG: hypothetical protein MUC33_19830, partial [Desulfobacterales bacterium]|nr:hypothetical protein [Desulfobacterales bacterium]